MRRGRGLAALTLVAISAVVAMCVYPTEHDADVFVTIDSLTLDTLSRTPTSVGPLVVIQGAEGDVHATAWHRQSAGPSAPVPNVSFRWSVADTTLARIDATTGHLVAIKAGITQVRVVATNFDVGAAPATLDIRVSAPLAIDSIRPDTLRYGEIATVYGVGLLDTIGVLLSIGDATLIPVPFTDTLKANGSSQISFWVPPQSHSCQGAAFAPKEAPADSTVVALHDFPAGSLDAIAVYSQPGRYALAVYEGYGTTGKGITRDAHEEDDYCSAADAKPDALPFQSSALTIDNPHDVDWFRFSFPGGFFQARTTAPASSTADPSDIDLYLLRVPNPGDTVMTVVASSTHPGSDEDIQPLLGLAAGQYYLVVTDFAGVPTPYSLCFGAGSCVPLPAPPAPSSSERQAAPTRRARVEAAIPLPPDQMLRRRALSSSPSAATR